MTYSATQDHALVFRFTYMGGRRTSRFIAVTRRPSEDGWFILIRSEWCREPEVFVHQAIGQCDHAFRTTVDIWTDQGFKFDRQVEIPIRTMTVEDSAVAWATSVMNPAVTLLDAWDTPPYRPPGTWMTFDTKVLAWTAG